jgi:REP element-mobilizing transposase RayT
MPHSYSSCLIHYVFSTKGRKKTIAEELRGRLWAYVGGIARENGMTALAVGGTDDHMHLLVVLPSTLSVAKAIQLIKGGSSKWLHDTFPAMKDFAWQQGYGAFGVGISGIEETVSYINRQKQHHRTTTFEDEFVAFLKRHGIDYDERYVWG